MAKEIEVTVEQASPSASVGKVRSHKVRVDRPESNGGADTGPMGGELILVGLGGCFMSNLLAAIRERKSPIHDVSVSVKATIDGTPERMSRFDVVVRARYEDGDEMRKLATIAARGCLVANTLTAGSEVKISVGVERRSPTRPPNHG